MSEKKVIVVIVEGPSDENAIGGILKEYFSTDEVQFAVVHGDITSNEFTTVDNVIRKIDELIKVIHIADTDGVFTKGCVMEAEVAEIRYYEDHMEGAAVEAIEHRNKHKSEILFKLYSTSKVHNIRYRIYFNSCNLEHVLYGVLKNFSDDEKVHIRKLGDLLKRISILWRDIQICI